MRVAEMGFLPDTLINEPAPPPAIEPFPFISARRLTEKPIKIDWIIDGIIERGSLNLLFGEPGSGKSLFALDWAFCLAAGLDWHNYRTKTTDVVIIAGEGFAGLSRRLKALEIKYGTKAPDRLFISQRSAQLLDETNALWVANSIVAMCPNPGLVVIDTLHRNMDGDENSSQDIGRFINNIDMFFRPLGAAVLVVHHSGHGDKNRSRGSSSIRAAMDGEFAATKNDLGITLTCSKSKDFEPFYPMQFVLQPTTLPWIDDDGEPLTSVVLDHLCEAPQAIKRRKLSARDKVILASLDDAIAAFGVHPTELKFQLNGIDTDQSLGVLVVSIEKWKNLAYKAITDDDSTDDALRMAFKRSIKKLLNQGHISECDNYAWKNSQ